MVFRRVKHATPGSPPLLTAPRPAQPARQACSPTALAAQTAHCARLGTFLVLVPQLSARDAPLGASPTPAAQLLALAAARGSTVPRPAGQLRARHVTPALSKQTGRVLLARSAAPATLQPSIAPPFVLPAKQVRFNRTLAGLPAATAPLAITLPAMGQVPARCALLVTIQARPAHHHVLDATQVTSAPSSDRPRARLVSQEPSRQAQAARFAVIATPVSSPTS